MLSSDLIERGEIAETFKKVRAFGRPTEAKPSYELETDVEIMSKIDEERSAQLTKTLAYLHSRGGYSYCDRMCTQLIIRCRRSFQPECRG
jgi:hypothetical protein